MWTDYVQLAVAVLSGGGIVYLLVERFARTKEQRGVDLAHMIGEVGKAFEQALNLYAEHSRKVIEELRRDATSDAERYEVLERRYERLERRFDDREADHELLKEAVGSAVDCKFLKDRSNNDCPVIRKNQKRVAAKCKACKPTAAAEKE